MTAVALDDGAALEARHAAARLRLPFRRRAWRGFSGNWSGVGVGSSIDFQDHRPYFPGDDPRHIDWRAYARTGNYIMKLYREEVSPAVDLAIDVSASMGLTPVKEKLVTSLTQFCFESAIRTGSFIRIYELSGGKIRLIAPEEISRGKWKPVFGASTEPPTITRVPWRTGSMRVLISDLLFAADPSTFMKGLLAGRGLPVVFSPYCREESDPDWAGNMELQDCESDASRPQYMDPALLREYSLSYKRHFDLWRSEATRSDALVARVEAGVPLQEGLEAEALKIGAVELWG